MFKNVKMFQYVGQLFYIKVFFKGMPMYVGNVKKKTIAIIEGQM